MTFDTMSAEERFRLDHGEKQHVPHSYVRLLYCSSVSPQAVAAGELLVYRHLRARPSRSVMVVAPDHKPVDEDIEPAVSISVPPAPKFVQRLRRHVLWSVADALAGSLVKARFTEQADRFRPQAVCSTLLPDSLLTAAASYAKERRLPLVLFCHDDYSDAVPPAGRRHLARIYRQAAVRFCVSSVMEREFFRRYGVRGTLLPPIPGHAPRPPQVQRAEDPLVVGFAGSIGVGYMEAMLRLAEALHRVGGRLVIASPTDRNLTPPVWQHPAVQDLGALRPDEVLSRFTAAGVNAVAVIQSFDPAERRAFRLNFPSKLAEYATFGLPVLVVAPDDASASLWLKDRPGVAILVDGLVPAQFAAAVERLRDADSRRQLAENIHAAAMEFDPATLHQRFETALGGVCH
ncbi:MAG: glycosyltransferase [Xanthobacteraceae bacterium]